MNRSTMLRYAYVATDLCASAGAFVVYNVVRYHVLGLDRLGFPTVGYYLGEPKILAEEILVPFFCLAVYWLSGYYNRPLGKSRVQELATTLFSCGVVALALFFALMTNDLGRTLSMNLLLAILLWGVLFAFVYPLRLFLTGYGAHKLWRPERMLAVGPDEASAAALREFLEREGHLRGSRVVASCGVDRAVEKAAECGAEEVVVATMGIEENVTLDIINRLLCLNIPIKVLPDTLSFLTAGIRLEDIFGAPLLDVTSPTMSESQKNIKRAMDFAVAAVGLVLASPLMLAVAIAVKLDSKGPVIYGQERIGLHKKPFTIYKFRSMRNDAEAAGVPLLSSDGDPRITRVGRILRKFRLDELPQFWNVLRGDMSIVGPRPERQYFIEQITERAPWFVLVQQVRPGLTSWGVVKNGYASNVDSMINRARYDLIYLQNMSLSVDLKIIIYTVRTILRGEGK